MASTVVNGYHIRGFWHCPECGYNNMAHGQGPHVCEECGWHLDTDDYEGDEGDT